MGIVVIAVLLVMCLLAPLLGSDSRAGGERDRRGWWPGSRGLR